MSKKRRTIKAPASARRTKRGNAGHPLWGGRFERPPAAVLQDIGTSIDFDKRLYAQDIAGSKAHCRMLMARGIITKRDGHAILKGLDAIAKEIASGAFRFDPKLEDIHMNIEARLQALIGEPAGRLHTARSRNDQVATDLRLWLREALDQLDQDLKGLQAALIGQAERHAATAMPGYTHLQNAQPVTFGHHLLAYAEMIGRDRARGRDCRERLNECPLGAAALAGTSFPIDRRMTAKALGFDRPAANSIDAVSDRDFALEFLAVAAIAAIHLSRLGEEIVLWASPQFSFIALSDGFASGSSIMPQKRNPDAAELVRAKAGRVIGALSTLAVAMKGLPLAYARDMQEDKEPTFDAADTLRKCIAAMTGMIADLTVDEEAMAAAAGRDFPTATDLADWLVRVRDIPFRRAHEITGKIVKWAARRNCRLADVPLAEMQRIEPGITAAVFDILSIERSIASRTSFGGTAPRQVRKAVARARERFL